jgi:hypothetical protein
LVNQIDRCVILILTGADLIGFGIEDTVRRHVGEQILILLILLAGQDSVILHFAQCRYVRVDQAQHGCRFISFKIMIID